MAACCLQSYFTHGFECDFDNIRLVYSVTTANRALRPDGIIPLSSHQVVAPDWHLIRRWVLSGPPKV